MRHDDGDPVIRCDFEPGGEPLSALADVLRHDAQPVRRDRNTHDCENQPASGEAARRDERSPCPLAHGEAPQVVEMERMARRTRSYVPQRQIFVIVAAISSSAGLGLRASSSATAMIIPD